MKRNKHVGYECSICGGSFTSNFRSRLNIKRHLKRMGWKFRLFKKPICGYCKEEHDEND